MRAAGVVELDPVTDGAGSVLDAFEAVPMHTLLFQRPDDTLDHAVLLRAMRSNELLPHAIAADQSRVMAAGEHQSIVGSHHERLGHDPKCSEPGDEGLLQRTGGCSDSPCADRDQPTTPRMAVDDQGQRCPAV